MVTQHFTAKVRSGRALPGPKRRPQHLRAKPRPGFARRALRAPRATPVGVWVGGHIKGPRPAGEADTLQPASRGQHSPPFSQPCPKPAETQPAAAHSASPPLPHRRRRPSRTACQTNHCLHLKNKAHANHKRTTMSTTAALYSATTMSATPPGLSRGPLSGRPMPAAASASTWLCGRGDASSILARRRCGLVFSCAASAAGFEK